MGDVGREPTDPIQGASWSFAPQLSLVYLPEADRSALWLGTHTIHDEILLLLEIGNDAH